MSERQRSANPDLDADHYVALIRDALEAWPGTVRVEVCYRCNAKPAVQPMELSASLKDDGTINRFHVRQYETFNKEWGTLRWKDKPAEGEREGVAHHAALCPDCVRMNQFEAGDVADG